MMAWFAGLEKREQVFVGIGGAIAVVILLWGGIWMPIESKHSTLRDDVSLWNRSVTGLQYVGARLAQGGGTAEPGRRPSNESAVVIVDRTLSELDLNSFVTRRQPTPNGIRVELEAVPFDELALWLGVMSDDYGMEVQAGNLSIASVGGPGRINASLTLERAP